MLNWLRKPNKVKKFRLVLEAPEFIPAEREHLQSFIVSQWPKIKKHLIAQMLTQILHNDVPEGFKDGWLACISGFQALPVLEKSDKDEEEDAEYDWTETET